jgi:two-component system, OmpR family, response regulator VicR
MTANGQQPHIVCINHSPEVLDLLQELLEGDGYRVTTRSHTDKDLDAIVALAPDLITLDYMWSSVDDDWTFLQLLRLDRRTAQIPLLLCTGAVREVEALGSHLREMGVAVVFKPFDIDQLLQAVQETLAREVAPKRTETLPLD